VTSQVSATHWLWGCFLLLLLLLLLLPARLLSLNALMTLLM
jgi:hypothetical protein